MNLKKLPGSQHLPVTPTRAVAHRGRVKGRRGVGRIPGVSTATAAKRNLREIGVLSATTVSKKEWVKTNGVGTTTVKFGFPKGSLQGSTVDLFDRAGFKLKMSERSYFPGIDDDGLELVLFRSQEIPRYVEDGLLDAGICGLDWIRESNADVVQVCELLYSKSTTNPARWVIAVDENSPVKTIHDLQDGIIASELVNTTEKFFKDRGVQLRRVEFSWGATEVKARIPGVAAIVDITETGSSLQANKLRIIDTIMHTTAQLVANKSSWANAEKRRQIEDLAVLLQGAIEGRQKVGLKMNAPKDKVDEICSLVPASLSPTVSPLLDSHFVAIEVVLDERTAREIVPQCQRCGASEILTYSLQSLITSPINSRRSHLEVHPAA